MNLSITAMTIVFFLSSVLLSGGTDRKVRVFVTSSNRSPNVVRAETVDHMNRSKHCRGLVATIDREKADYIIVHDDTGAGPGRKPQKIAVFNRGGDIIYSGATRSVGGAVKDACAAILDDVKTNKLPK